MPPGSRLVSFITGRQPGLSEEAKQGRKEVLWISASVWLPPIDTWLKTILAAPEGGRAGSLVPSIVVNTILFFALARGDPGARKFTLVMLIPAEIAHTISPFLPYAAAPGVPR